ncbi:hypothetical protein NFI96_030273, partial [Prochilodus magdalenae]
EIRPSADLFGLLWSAERTGDSLIDCDVCGLRHADCYEAAGLKFWTVEPGRRTMLPDQDGPSGGGATQDAGGVKEDSAVSLFREYLRLKTVHPEPDYDAALKFLTRISEELGLPMKTIEVCPGRVVIIMTWTGTNPSLKSVLLNSHTDVVPVYQATASGGDRPHQREVARGLSCGANLGTRDNRLCDVPPQEHWKYDAFAAVKDAEGNIYGRGTQDMKCVTVQYIEAIRRLKAAGKRFPRTIHLTFVPDEEVGGHKGMETFIKHPEFQKLNVGFALDEGLANPTEAFTVFYGERNPWCKDTHLIRCCVYTVRRVMNSFLDFREREKRRLDTSECFTLGDVTTVNMTMVRGGVAYNVIPAEMDVSFDMRIPPTVNLQEFEEQIKAWCAEAGEGITYEFAQKFIPQNTTSTEDSDPWWSAFSSTCKALSMTLEKEIFPAATDSRFIRAWIIFSDESRVGLGGDAQRIRVWRHRGQHQDERSVVTRPEDLVSLHLHPYRTICRNCVRMFKQHGMDYHRTPLGTSTAPYRDVWCVGLANTVARR